MMLKPAETGTRLGEIKVALKTIFDEIDTDKNEVKEALEKVGGAIAGAPEIPADQALADQMVGRMIKMVDLNGDGVVTFDEIYAAFVNLVPVPNDEIEDYLEKMPQEQFEGEFFSGITMLKQLAACFKTGDFSGLPAWHVWQGMMVLLPAQEPNAS